MGSGVHAPQRQPVFSARSPIKTRMRTLLKFLQLQVHLLLPCYDFAQNVDPTIKSRLSAKLRAFADISSSKAVFPGVTGGVYKARSRIHRAVMIRDY